jgi:hypothetical protein
MKKIVQYFQKGKSDGVFNGLYIMRSSDGEVVTKPLKKVKLLPKQKYECKEKDVQFDHSLWGAYSEISTVGGDCGAPLLINSGYGYSIVGLHFLANSINTVYAIDVDGDFIRAIYDKLDPFNIERGDYTLVSAPTAERKVGDLHKKSVFRYLKEGNANVYGSFTDFRGKTKSKVVDTPMSKYLKNENYSKLYTAPQMTTWVPWRIAALDLVKPITKINTQILNKCVDSYITDVMSQINLEDVSNMMIPLDNFTAINGATVAYIDKINRNTSAGNPWKKCKKYFLTPSPPDHGMQDPVTVDPEIMERVDCIIETYLEKRQAHPNFCAHLKDEPVTFKKAKMGKTRVFTGAPFDWTIVVRKFLLSFCRLQQHNRFAFEAAPGTIAQSLEWHELYVHITKYGLDRIVAGDYKAFDKRMSPKEILAAFDVIIHFCKLSGNYTPQEILVIRGIAQDTAYALVDYNGDLVQLFGSNPSGHPLTVVINGIVNSLRMRYSFFTLEAKHHKGEPLQFKDCVSLMTYGDDNIMSVREGLDWFNHTAIQETFADLDIVYTMPDKEAESVPYINICDATFLKRTWRFDKTLKCFLAPLEHESIEKMLMTWTKSKSVCEEVQGISVITSALREYFFYGKEIYDEKLELFKKLVSQLGWEIYVEESTFLTHDELCKCFEIASKQTVLFDYYFGRHV